MSSSSQHHSSNGGNNNVGSSSSSSGNNRQRNNVISCVTVGDSDTEENRRCNSPKPHQTHNIKYEPHAGQSQKKRLLAMAQNECLLTSSSNLHIPKQEPTELIYEYPLIEKRASWAPPAHHNHHKRDSVPYISAQQAPPPPIAHSKNVAAAASWGAQIYRQHQSNTPLGGSPGGVLQQDLYAQSDAMYRRPTVFVSQAPYQSYNRVVPPPAHNGSSRQVS